MSPDCDPGRKWLYSASGIVATPCAWKVEEDGSPTSTTGFNHGAEAYTKSCSCLFSYWGCESGNEYF